ncbi:MAG TPA: FadR/GntR family transcriptional regulator [Chloroflexota bacterium]|nr:FadR/GntR family transcriptional regulator [Chloroflexota bacterium]
MFERLHIPKASEVLAGRLRGAILGGDLPQGGALPPEKELMVQLGVSRATVREGLRLLEAEGLITTRVGRGGGATVGRPGPSAHTRSLALLLQFDGTTLGELLEARRAIEPFCGRLAAERATREELAELGATLGELAGLVDDREAYLTTQARFHVLIAYAARNPVLRIYAPSLAELICRQIERAPFTRDDLATGVASCGSILEGMEQRDPDRTERRILRHLSAIEEAIVRLGWPLEGRPSGMLAVVGGLS